MSFFEKKYNVTRWSGTRYYLTAKQLYKRVLNDSKSDYNWIASATELVRVCNEPSFPEKYAVAIKIIILNCFANLELQKEYSSNKEVTDNASVYSCYYSLPSDDETVIKVKHKYLCAIITSITKYAYNEVRLPLHRGPTYSKMCEEWKKRKFDEYVDKKDIDFNELRQKLYDDFEYMIKSAEVEGIFREDDAKYYEELSKFWASINLKDL